MLLCTLGCTLYDEKICVVSGLEVDLSDPCLKRLVYIRLVQLEERRFPFLIIVFLAQMQCTFR